METGHNLQGMLRDLGVAKGSKGPRRPLALFLGAGVNKGLAPRWSELLGGLLSDAVAYRLGGHESVEDCKSLSDWLTTCWDLSDYEKGNLVRRLMGRHYITNLRHRLYSKSQPIEQAPTEWSLLDALASLCQSRQVQAVVTYNYDDLLEEQLRRRTRTGHPLSGRLEHAPSDGRIPVYHVHGYLPRSPHSLDRGTESVVLAQEEYNAFVLEPFAWQTTVQLHYLRNAVCLFVGASLRDMNMIRLASHAKTYQTEPSVYVMQANCDALRQAPDDALPVNWRSRLRVMSSLYDDIGVRLVLAEDHAIIESQLREIARRVGET